MGQKTPSPSLRLSLNRQHDLCWFKENNSYSELLIKDFQYRAYIESICSQLPSLINFSRVFSSAYPKKYDIHLFPHFQNQLNTNLNTDSSKSVKHSLNQNQVFQDFLSHKYRQAQFGASEKMGSELLNQMSLCVQTKKQDSGSAMLIGMEQVAHKLTHCHTKIGILKTSHIESSAHFFNAILIESFKKSNAPRRVIKSCLKLAEKSPYILGIRITCAGRFNGVERARLETRSWGQTSLQHLDSHVDYSSKAALTNTGLLGIKVWVSYVKPLGHL